MRAWSPEEERRLRRLYAEGYAPRSWRRLLPGRSPIAIERARVRLGLRGMPQGYVTPSAVAQAAGVDVQTCMVACRWAGVPVSAYAGRRALASSARHPLRIVDRADALEAVNGYLHRCTSGRLARVCGVTPSTIRVWLRAAGLVTGPMRGHEPHIPWPEAAEVCARRLGSTPERVLATAVRMGLADAIVLTPARVIGPPSDYVNLEGAA